MIPLLITQTWRNATLPAQARPFAESWRRLNPEFDYRLFDVQHAVLPTTLPLNRFYEELVKTQSILARKHLGWKALRGLPRTELTRLSDSQIKRHLDEPAHG